MISKILFLFFFSLVVHSQNLTSKYQHILPKEVLNNPTLLENTNRTILQEVKLSPELLYYRIHFLNEVYVYKNTDKKTNGLVELKNARKKYIDEQNKWVKNQISILDKKYSQHKYSSKVKIFFDNLLVESRKTNSNLTYNVDKNKMNFFVVFIYSNGEINRYNKSTNYLSIREKYELEKLKDISVIESRLQDNLDSETAEIYSLIENNCFIFTKKAFEKDFPGLLILQLKKEYNINNLNKISIWGYKLVNMTSIVEREIKTTLIFDDDFSFGTIKYNDLYGVGINYKLFLKNEIEYFSYLNFGIFYTVFNTVVDVNKSPGYLRQTVLDGPEIKVFEFYDVSDVKLESANNAKIGLNITTPVVVLLPKITIDIGIELSYQNIGYSTYTTYDYKKIKSYYKDDGYFDYSEILETKVGVEEKYNYNEYLLNFRPIVSLNMWNLFDFLDLRVLTSYDYIKIGAGASF